LYIQIGDRSCSCCWTVFILKAGDLILLYANKKTYSWRFSVYIHLNMFFFFISREMNLFLFYYLLCVLVPAYQLYIYIYTWLNIGQIKKKNLTIYVHFVINCVDTHWNVRHYDFWKQNSKKSFSRSIFFTSLHAKRTIFSSEGYNNIMLLLSIIH
jgi:hypothetical protein